MARWALTVRRVRFLAVSYTAGRVSLFQLFPFLQEHHVHIVACIELGRFRVLDIVRVFRRAYARLGIRFVRTSVIPLRCWRR